MRLLPLLFLPFAYIHAFSRITSAPENKQLMPSKPIIVGSTKPIENFDPLNFGKNEERLVFYREAELKHGRLGMVAASLIPIIEQNTHTPAIYEFNKFPETIQIAIVSAMFVTEFASMFRGWKNPFEGNGANYFKLREDYQPGDIGFELPTNLNSDEGKYLMNKELNNGRLAMIAALGMMAQELVTNKPIF